MYLPVFVFFLAVLGSVAIDSRADERIPSSGLHGQYQPLNYATVSSPGLFGADGAFGSHHRVTSDNKVKVGDNSERRNSKHSSSERATLDTRQRLIQRAHTLIGIPYKLGSMSETKGFDCSGLLVYLFRNEAGVELPRTTRSMIHEKFTHVPRDEMPCFSPTTDRIEWVM